MEKIPYMKEQAVKENYVKLLVEKLGDSNRLHFSPAALTSGIIVARKATPQYTAKSHEEIERVYIVGVPASEKQSEQRGIGIMMNSQKSQLYQTLIKN